MAQPRGWNEKIGSAASVQARRDMKQSLGLVALVVREPAERDYGTVAVFRDLYGNLWDLIQPRSTR